MVAEKGREAAAAAAGGTAERVQRSLRLLWDPRPARPARGPKPGLNLDQIVDTAIRLADTEGLEALSMRRVARELGVGTMSLYRYVPGKPELLDLMLDRVSDPTESAERCRGLDWRGVVEATARTSREMYLAHPWLLQVNWTRPVLGPNSVAGLDGFLTSLAGVSLSAHEKVAVLVMIDSFVVGTARRQIMYAAEVAQTGLTDEEFWTQQSSVLEQAMRSGDYPAMAALPEDAFGMGWDEGFEWGLRRLADGLAVLVGSRG
jgi:AcrR family transcriptional regulator